MTSLLSIKQKQYKSLQDFLKWFNETRLPVGNRSIDVVFPIGNRSTDIVLAVFVNNVRYTHLKLPIRKRNPTSLVKFLEHIAKYIA